MARFRDIREPKPEREERWPVPNRRKRRSLGIRRSAGHGRAFRRQLAATAHPLKGRVDVLRAQRGAEIASRAEAAS